MARIEERQNKTGTSWRVVWYRDGKRQPRMTFSTYEQARRWKVAIEQTDGDPNRAARMLEQAGAQIPTLDEAAEHDLARRRTAPFTKQTYRSYMRNHIRPQLGDRPVDLITADDVRRFIAYLEDRGLAVKTMQSIASFLGGVFAHAQAQGWVTESPYSHQMLPAEGPKDERDKFLTRAEVELIMPHLRPGHVDPCRFLLATGLRPGEMRALTVEDVSLDARQPTVRITKAMRQDREKGDYVGPPKSSLSVRSVGLPPSVVNMLRLHVDGRSPTDVLFVGSTGKRLSPTSLRHSWRDAVMAARDGNLTKTPPLYSLRHTHASLMLDAGMSIWQLAKHLGHSAQMTEEIYGHLMPEATYKTAQAAETAIYGTSSPAALPAS